MVRLDERDLGQGFEAFALAPPVLGASVALGSLEAQSVVAVAAEALQVVELFVGQLPHDFEGVRVVAHHFALFALGPDGLRGEGLSLHPEEVSGPGDEVPLARAREEPLGDGVQRDAGVRARLDWPGLGHLALRAVGSAPRAREVVVRAQESVVVDHELAVALVVQVRVHQALEVVVDQVPVAHAPAVVALAELGVDVVPRASALRGQPEFDVVQVVLELAAAPPGLFALGDGLVSELLVVAHLVQELPGDPAFPALEHARGFLPTYGSSALDDGAGEVLGGHRVPPISI